MGYPDAYCVKCGTHTSTQKKQTVVLQNNARALKGECPTCATEVYKILPKGKAFKTTVDREESYKKKYPDAYCVKCHEHTPTLSAKTVIMENGSRAMTGTCGKCGSAAYRILGQKAQADVVRDDKKTEMKREDKIAVNQVAASDRRVPLTRRVDIMETKHNTWANVIGLVVIFGTVAAFLAYSIF